MSKNCSVIILKSLDRENMEKITLSIVIEDEHGKINTPQNDTGQFSIVNFNYLTV